MKTRLLPLAALTVLALAACGGGGEAPALSGEPVVTTEATTTTAPHDGGPSSSSGDEPDEAAGMGATPTAAAFPAPGQPAPDGAHAAEILAIDVEAGTVTVDLIELLTGDDATAACEEQGASPDECPMNDYVIRDTEEDPRTFPLAEDATFTIVDMSSEVTNVEATLEELVAAHAATPFTVWVVLEGGTVGEIHQQFVP